MKKNLFLFVTIALVCVIWPIAGCGGSDADNLADGGPDGSSDADNDSDTDADSDTDIDSDVDADSDTDTGTEEECGESNFVISAAEVDMLIVLDRSNSMYDGDLWTEMGNALVEVTSKMQDYINFGLMLFPSLDCINEPPKSQCSMPSDAHVEINQADAIQAIADTVDPTDGVGCCGGTPTGAALDSARTYLNSVEDELDRFVLLATDGAPNCNSDINENSCKCTALDPEDCDITKLACLDDSKSYDAAFELYNSGYKTYVIGVGGTIEWQDVMNGIASAGKTEQYYPATDATELLNAFEAITGAIINCEFNIDWTSIPEDASEDPDKVNFYGIVDSDEEVIVYDEGCAKGVGWNWVDEDAGIVLFCDGACSLLKAGHWDEVRATFGCESTSIVE
ncbi:MAG: VWA domain-containing protein [Proteobacteria bacterium]|nr:VWA domain-containing protein [Pseudomonadota bacterium]